MSTRCKRSQFASMGIACSVTVLLITQAGCSPTYHGLRQQGQRAMLGEAYGPAQYFFRQADAMSPRRIDNLHDLGVCSVMLAREKFHMMNHAAAMRELDSAIAYYSRALDVHPGHLAALEGKNIALELKGQFDEALKEAEWAAEFVGPAATQYVFLASELEERGDVDGALLRYRQAVAVEPDNFAARVEFARFLIRSNSEPAAVFQLQAAYLLDPRDAWVTDQLAARGAIPVLAAEEPDKPN